MNKKHTYSLQYMHIHLQVAPGITVIPEIILVFTLLDLYCNTTKDLSPNVCSP